MVVDGGVDQPRARQRNPNASPDTLIDPDGIAETFWFLAHQDRRSFTFEVDVRTNVEKW